MRQQPSLTKQSNVLIVLILLLFSSIAGRLFWLQIINGKYYRSLSDGNRIRLVSTPPIRGKILDTNGVVLASNKLRFSLIVQPHLMDDQHWKILSENLSTLLDINITSLESRYQQCLLMNYGQICGVIL